MKTNGRVFKNGFIISYLYTKLLFTNHYIILVLDDIAVKYILIECKIIFSKTFWMLLSKYNIKLKKNNN